MDESPVGRIGSMIRTGIGGWVFPPWRGGAFYPAGLTQKRELEFASRALRAIEINSTFHSLQKRDTFRRWRTEVPDGFVFAVKGSRFITNRKDLATAQDAFGKFWAQGLDELGDALGPILWQLAATKRFVAGEVAAFLDLLPRELNGLPLRHAIEASHVSFACREFADIARDRKIAIAYVEADDVIPTGERTADFAYLRCKRMTADCPTGYPQADLARLARQCRAWGQQGEVFAFMINGAKVRAPAAALALAEKLKEAK
ncbi:MAG: DUF72 domain-containing protein [Croceibacterium sp.]